MNFFIVTFFNGVFKAVVLVRILGLSGLMGHVFSLVLGPPSTLSTLTQFRLITGGGGGGGGLPILIFK